MHGEALLFRGRDAGIEPSSERTRHSKNITHMCEKSGDGQKPLFPVTREAALAKDRSLEKGWVRMLEVLARGIESVFKFPFDAGGEFARGARLKLLNDFGFDPDLDLAAATWFAPCTWSRSPSSGSRFLFPFLHLSASCDCKILLIGGRLVPLIGTRLIW